MEPYGTKSPEKPFKAFQFAVTVKLITDLEDLARLFKI